MEDDVLQRILSGKEFESQKVLNFIEKDFYQWVATGKHYENLKSTFRKIAVALGDYDFRYVNNDILKGVYQELIDIETKRDLGEYYTPDWLCEVVVNTCDFKPADSILDPSCGSGSFLMAALQRLRTLHPGLTAEQLTQQVVGIDIHPLSVQIAKTTLVLGLGDLIRKAKKAVHLRVYLANTILAPQGEQHILLGEKFKVSLDGERYELDTELFGHPSFFDQAIHVSDYFAEDDQHKHTKNERSFTKLLQSQMPPAEMKADVYQEFYKIYLGMLRAKEAGRDTIWRFILQNVYKPFFLRKRFDYVIGNPPWFTYKDVSSEEYQEALLKLANKYRVEPASKKDMPHLEIAAIFLAHAINYFLKPNGKVAFVLPRAFLNGSQHHYLRMGSARHLRLTEIWDLDKVKNLFNIPSCVLFAQHEQRTNNKPPKEGLEGLAWQGNPRRHNATWAEAQLRLTNKPVKWFASEMDKFSAFTNKPLNFKNQVNHYKEYFKQGATLVPRNFYFVDTDDAPAPTGESFEVYARTAKANLADAKPPWKELLVEGWVNSTFIYRTALAKNIVPFALINPPLVLLPLILPPTGQPRLLTVKQLLEQGELNTAKWFGQVDDLWDKHKTENNKRTTAIQYLNWQKKLTDQNLNARYLVLYTASAKDANAVVLDRETLDRNFIVESKAYVYFTNSEEEAHYLCCYLNCQIPNLAMKEFQTRGLFGPRDVHKKILELPFPKFNPTDALHQSVAEAGKAAAQKASAYFGDTTVAWKTDDYNVGQLRQDIKAHLHAELTLIDELVGKVMGVVAGPEEEVEV